MFHIFCQKYNLRGVKASHMKNKIKTSPQKNEAIKLQGLLHFSHSYAIFHRKLENREEVNLLWVVTLT